MTTKKSYSIPASLDRSFLDHEIGIGGKGWSMQPIALKVILFYIGSAFILVWTLTNSWVSSAGVGLQALVIIWWIAATMFFGKYTSTKELNLFTLPALVKYLPKQNRRVITRSNSRPGPFYQLVRIDDIDETGFIRFSDGTVGQAYGIVGSASVLIFEADKQMMLNRVDSFWRKADIKVEHTFITTKEPQRVYRQMANLEKQNRRLKNRDPELFELLDERFDIMKNHVGGSYNSIHQYLVLKAQNVEALRKAHATLQNEAAESSLMIKELSVLDRQDVYEMLRTIYRPMVGVS